MEEEIKSAPADKIIKNLYLGGMRIYENNFLEKNKITHIVCVKSPEKSVVKTLKNQGVKFYNFITSHDEFHLNFEKKFEAIYVKILSAMSKGENVVIHCRSGKHRSVAILVAFLMKYYGHDWDEVFQFVKQKRPCVDDVNHDIVKEYFLKYYNKVEN